MCNLTLQPKSQTFEVFRIQSNRSLQFSFSGILLKISHHNRPGKILRMKEINNLHKYTFLYNSYMLQSSSQIENDLFHLIKYSICK